MPNKLDWKCAVCGIRAKLPSNHGVIHCPCGYTQYKNPPGLGDRTAAMLARIGITEKRYNKARRAIGIKKPCGCKKRQQKLNRVLSRKASNNGN